MIYNIKLKIIHSYPEATANGRHIFRVLPRTLGQRQHLTTHVLDVAPGPDARSDTVDFFGNAATTCAHLAPHMQMAVDLACHVEMSPPPQWRDTSPDLSDVRHQWQTWSGLEPDAPVHFLGKTARLAPDAQIAEFARSIFAQDKSVAANVLALGKALFDLMTFDGTATNVDTDPAEAFQLKRGVCQDFSHIMIMALQSLGIPAAYVSGYLRTLPPEGGTKLAGADAMHAWVRAWCGAEMGWIEYDPTNATRVGTDHIVVGYGRDYTDIAPVRGHLRGSDMQQNSQAVDVVLVG